MKKDLDDDIYELEPVKDSLVFLEKNMNGISL